MRLFNHRTIYSSLFYVLAVILLMLAKPSIMFDERTGEVKQFGVGSDHKTIFSLGVANGIIALVSFYIFTMIDVIFATKNSL